MSEPGQRVRSRNDGQLGYLVQVDSGVLMVRLDRGARVEHLIPYRDEEWVEDTRRVLTPMQAGRIAYEADKALRTVLGEYGVKDWISLREHEQHKWISKPALGVDDTRHRLHAAILAALKAGE